MVLWVGLLPMGDAVAQCIPPNGLHWFAPALLRMERPQEALDVLRSQARHALPANLDFWLAYGDVEWHHGSRNAALAAYLHVWVNGADEAWLAERLYDGWAEQGAWELAIVLADDAFERLNEPRWLLLMMDAAARANEWDLLRSGLERAQALESLFVDSEIYWLLQGHLAMHDQHHGQAMRAYRRALELQPDSVPLRLQLLVVTLADGLEPDLAELLELWQTEALEQPAYWPVYVLGRLRLGQLESSLDWLERYVLLRPQDYALQADYLLWLEQVDPQRLAPQVRRQILSRLTLVLAPPGAPVDSGKQGVLLRLASIVHAWDPDIAEGDEEAPPQADR